jgi:glycosyltransferase involved in cell wall biosynthesis
MQEVIKQISERLVSYGHEVTVATRYDESRRQSAHNGVQIAPFEISGNLVLGIKGTHDEIKRYQKFLIESNFDVIVNFAAQQWASDLSLDILDSIPAKKIFVPTGFSGLFLKEYADYFKNMVVWMKRYDMNVFLSHTYQDIKFAQKNNINKIAVISNGASESEFLKPVVFDVRTNLGLTEDTFLILHVGSHTGCKGHDEVLDIFLKAKLKNSALLIIGNFFDSGLQKNYFKEKLVYLLKLLRIKKIRCPERCHIIAQNNNSDRIFIKSFNREQTIAAFQQADLFIFPSNIECSPIVLFEAMASKTPFFVSDVGNAAEIISQTDAGVLLPTKYAKNGYTYADVKKSAELIHTLCADKDKLIQMAENGYQAWQKHFTWEKITKQYETLYLSLIN